MRELNWFQLFFWLFFPPQQWRRLRLLQTGGRSSSPSPKKPSKTCLIDWFNWFLLLMLLVESFSLLTRAPDNSRECMYVGGLSAYRHREALTVWAPPSSWCPVHPSIVWSSLSSVSPNIPPTGSLYLLLLQMSRPSFVVRAFSLSSSATCMHADPNGVGTESSPPWCNICSVLGVPFPRMTFPLALMNQNCSKTGKSLLVG